MSDKDQRNSGGSRMVRATVANGRTVDVPDGDKRAVAKFGEDGKPIMRAVLKTYHPGQEVELPADEVKQLRAGGYLVDPNASAPPTGEGPQFNVVTTPRDGLDGKTEIRAG